MLVHLTAPNLSIASYTNGSFICARNSPSNYAGTTAYLQDNCSIVQSARGAFHFNPAMGYDANTYSSDEYAHYVIDCLRSRRIPF